MKKPEKGTTVVLDNGELILVCVQLTKYIQESRGNPRRKRYVKLAEKLLARLGEQVGVDL